MKLHSKLVPALVPFCIATLAAFAPCQDKEKAAKVDFAKDVWPVLEKRCVECHSAPHTGADGKVKKPKGGVVLDSKEGITTSKKGKLVVAKNLDDSKLFHSISLPADDEDRMPPAKKGEPLSKEQIQTIKTWIEQGADFGGWTGAKAAESGKDKEKDKDKPGAKGSEKPGDKPASKPGEGKGEELPPVAPEALAAFSHGPFGS